MTSYSNQSSVPQGFSIFQPTLGAQLQFLPALGTKQLDDMINAYIPGPMSLQEKRAAVSLDFLGHSEATGQTFKFYAVTAAQTPETSLSASPLQGSVSSVSASPVASNWDWSGVPVAPSTTSRSSAGASTSRRASSTSTPRHQTTDFSHLPGMKIMTKEGLDVTNSASRGSKTKEQRDHAHLMRIIKACESCKKKKTRCDPSHKKRGVSQAQGPAGVTKPSKKARTSPQAVTAIPAAPPPAATASRAQDTIAASPSFGASESLFSSDQFAPGTAMPESLSWVNWDDWMQEAPAEAEPDYDFFYDPEGYLSSSSQSSFNSPSTDLLDKSISPTGLTTTTTEVGAMEPDYNDYYDDFLFSPEDQCLETGQSPIQTQPASVVFEQMPRDLSECPPPYIGRSGLEGLNYYDSSQYYDAHLLEREENIRKGLPVQSVSTVPSLASSSSSGVSSASESLSPSDQSPDEYSEYIAPCPPPHAPWDGTQDITTTLGADVCERPLTHGFGESSGLELMGHHLLQGSDILHGCELLQGSKSAYEDGLLHGGEGERPIVLQNNDQQEPLYMNALSQQLQTLKDIDQSESSLSAVLQTSDPSNNGLGHAIRSMPGERMIELLAIGGMPYGTMVLLQTLAPLSSIPMIAAVSAFALMLFSSWSNVAFVAMAVAVMTMNKFSQAQNLGKKEQDHPWMTLQITSHTGGGSKVGPSGPTQKKEEVVNSSPWNVQRKTWSKRLGSSLNSMLFSNMRPVGLC